MIFWKILLAIVDLVIFTASLIAGAFAFTVLTVAFLSLFK